MKRQLHLTSPLMKGPDARYARNLLATKGYLEFETSRVNNVYDEDAAAATRRAKYELGYPDKYINGAFGTKLERYLRGYDKLPLFYRRRAAKRASSGIGRKGLAEARKWEGTTEKPANSNIAKPFTEWYGWHGWGAPWCAVFVSFCLNKAGFKYVKPSLARWAYVPYVLRDARAKEYGLSILKWSNVPGVLAKGDAAVLVLFDWDDDGVPDHIGIVSSVTGHATFKAWEGNTSFGNNSNGGKVMHRDRRISDAIAFVKAG